MQTASTDISPWTGLNDRQIPRLTGLHRVVYIEHVAVWRMHSTTQGNKAPSEEGH